MTDVMTQTQGGALATGGDPFSAYAKAFSADQRPYLKFNKGDWLLGKDDEEIKPGARFLANVAGLEIGWIKWWDKAPADKRMGFLVEGFQPPKREELGDLNRDAWQTMKDARTGEETPRDPWQFTNLLPLKAAGDAEEIVFTASSRGGLGAITTLCAAYGKEYRQRPGQTPVVELGVDTYEHKVYGRTKVPTLKIVDWVKDEPAAAEPKKEATKPKPKF